MKKLLKIILVVVGIFIAFPILFYGGYFAWVLVSNDQNDIVGRYQSVQTASGSSISGRDKTITFNENGTYDTGRGYKGTYSVSPGYVQLDGDLSNSYTFKDDHYLYTGNNFYWGEDVEYGLEPTFDDNGRSNQTFTCTYTYGFTLAGETADGNLVADMQYRETILSLHNDGTYEINDDGNLISEGTYQLEDDILRLNYDGGSMPLIYDGDKIYFDVYEKQE